MITLIAMLFLLASTSPQDVAPDAIDLHQCGETTRTYFPEHERKPSPNIALRALHDINTDGRSCSNINDDALRRLHAALESIVVDVFTGSPGKYSVVVRYALSPDSPALFDMQVLDSTEGDSELLDEFHNRASALKEFHSSNGTVDVVFHYGISPDVPNDG